MAEYIIKVEEGSKADLFRKRMASEPTTMYGCAIVGEIVRCRDCKFYGCYDGSIWCSRTYEQVPGGTCDYQTVDPDGFCAWGERRGK